MEPGEYNIMSPFIPYVTGFEIVGGFHDTDGKYSEK
jgi:hypothetical protein